MCELSFKDYSGFTLIELMITVAIVAIIAAIALPSYQSQVRDGRRADCAAVLMQARQQMERYYSKNYNYNTNDVADVGIAAKCPVDGDATYYNLALAGGQTAYTITATPAGAQSGDECGNLAINQIGQRGAKGNLPAARADIDQCWR